MAVIEALVRPSTFFADREEFTIWRPAVVVLFTALANLAGVALIVRRMAQGYAGQNGELIAVVGAVTLGTSFVGAFVLWVITAGILYLVSGIFGGDGSYRDVLAVTGWGYLPGTLSGIVSTVLILLVLQDVPVPTISELTTEAGREAVTAFRGRVRDHSLTRLSAIPTTGFLLWRGAIWAYGVHQVRGIGLGEAALASAIPVGLFFLWNVWPLL